MAQWLHPGRAMPDAVRWLVPERPVDLAGLRAVRPDSAAAITLRHAAARGAAAASMVAAECAVGAVASTAAVAVVTQVAATVADTGK